MSWRKNRLELLDELVKRDLREDKLRIKFAENNKGPYKLNIRFSEEEYVAPKDIVRYLCDISNVRLKDFETLFKWFVKGDKVIYAVSQRQQKFENEIKTMTDEEMVAYCKRHKISCIATEVLGYKIYVINPKKKKRDYVPLGEEGGEEKLPGIKAALFEEAITNFIG